MKTDSKHLTGADHLTEKSAQKSQNLKTPEFHRRARLADHFKNTQMEMDT
jgi:hypothetical protein